MFAERGEEAATCASRLLTGGPGGTLCPQPRGSSGLRGRHAPARLSVAPSGCLSPKPELGVTKGRPGSRCPDAGTAGPGTWPKARGVALPWRSLSASVSGLGATWGDWVPGGKWGSLCGWRGEGCWFLTPSQPVQDTLVSQRSLGGPPNPPPLPLSPPPPHPQNHQPLIS